MHKYLESRRPEGSMDRKKFGSLFDPEVYCGILPLNIGSKGRKRDSNQEAVQNSSTFERKTKLTT